MNGSEKARARNKKFPFQLRNGRGIARPKDERTRRQPDECCDRSLPAWSDFDLLSRTGRGRKLHPHLAEVDVKKNRSAVFFDGMNAGHLILLLDDLGRERDNRLSVRQRNLSVGTGFRPGHLVIRGGELRCSDGDWVSDADVLRIFRGKGRSGYK